MKKLLAMILMLGVSLPVLADEVKLSCKFSDGHTTYLLFDQKAGTVNRVSVNDNSTDTCRMIVSDDRVELCERSMNGNVLNNLEVNRNDGSSRYWNIRKQQWFHGTCDRATQKF